jgi:predicted RND superfamily exporter protein
MNNEKINRFTTGIGMNIIIKYRWLFLLLILFLVIFGTIGAQKIEMETSNEAFMPENDPTVINNNRFKEIFGNEDFVFIFFEAEDVFDYKVLKFIRDVTTDLKKNLPFAKEVVSLTNVEYIEAKEDVIKIDPLIGEQIPRDEALLRQIKKKTLSKKAYVNRIISKNAKYTGIAINLRRLPDHVYIPFRKNFAPTDQANWPADQIIMRKDIKSEEEARAYPELKFTRVTDPMKLIAPALKVITARHQPGTKNFKVMVTGIPVIDFEGEVILGGEMGKFGGLALLAAFIFLIVVFRSFRSLIGPILVLIATIIILFGILGWLHVPFSMAGMIILPLLLVISVSYSIHVINHFQRHFRQTGKRRESVGYSFENATWPCFLTALTTALGFASFAVVPVKPIRDVGLACAGGVFLTYFLVMVLVPIFFSFGKDKSPQNSPGNVTAATGNKRPWLTQWADFVIKHSIPVVVVSVIVTGLVIVYATKARVDTDAFEMMGDKLQYINEGKYIADRLGGHYSFEILVELPRQEMAKNPDVLTAVEKVTQNLEKWENTTAILSINDVIKDINMTMHNNDENYYTIPGNRDLIAQYLLLYEMSGGEGLEDYVDLNYQFLRLSVLVNKYSTAFGKKFFQIKHLAEKLFPQGTQVTVVGDIPILFKMVNLVSYGQIKSLFVAFIVIALVMILIIRSLKVGIISMIPNILPVLVIFGLMGIFDFPLDSLTFIVAPMIIGIAVDDTVHYIIHFKQEFHKKNSYSEANRETFVKVGRAILFTSVILAIGFSIMGLSVVKSMTHMAILSAAGILAALAADLFLTPVLFVYLKPFKTREKAKNN